MSQVKKFFSFGRKGTRKDSPSTEKKFPHPIGENEAEAHATTTSSPTRTKEKKRNERRAVSAIQLAAVATPTTTTPTTTTTSNERLTRTLPRTSEKSPTPRTPPPKPKPRRALPIVSATTKKPTKPVDDDDDDDYSEPKDATVVKETTNCDSDDDDYSKPCGGGGGGGDQRPRPAKRVVNRATYEEPWDRKFRGSAAVVQTIGQSTSNSSTRHKSSARGGGGGDDGDDGLGDYDDPWDKVPADRVGRVVKATKKLPQSEQPDADDYEFPHDKRLTAEGVVKQKLPSSSSRNDDYDDPWDSKVHAKVGPKKPPRARHLPSTGSNDYDDPWDSSGHARLPPPPNRPVPSGPKSNPSSPATSPVSVEDSFAPKPVIDASLPLHSQSWFHGAISRAVADRLLRSAAEYSFLVRVSESNTKDYSLSVRCSTEPMHLKIRLRPGHGYVLGEHGRPFHTIPELIKHYTSHKVKLKDSIAIFLLYPIKRT